MQYELVRGRDGKMFSGESEGDLMGDALKREPSALQASSAPGPLMLALKYKAGLNVAWRFYRTWNPPLEMAASFIARGSNIRVWKKLQQLR